MFNNKRKIRFIFLTLTILILLPARVFAQLDQREPGIYAVVGEKSVPLSDTGGWYNNTSLFSSIHNIVRYDGMTSGVEASDTFVLVIDPERIVITSSCPFARNITPSHLLILRLTVNAEKECRDYDPGERLAGEQLMIERPPFEWDQISDNSFIIKVFGLTPGEYAFAVRDLKTNPFDFRCIFDFTIKAQAE